MPPHPLRDDPSQLWLLVFHEIAGRLIPGARAAIWQVIDGAPVLLTGDSVHPHDALLVDAAFATGRTLVDFDAGVLQRGHVVPLIHRDELLGALVVARPMAPRRLRGRYRRNLETLADFARAVLCYQRQLVARISRGATVRLEPAGCGAAPRDRAPAPRLLIVDDERRLADVLRDSLSRDPGAFLVETAADGAEALGKVESFKPVLVILDLVMPGLHGIEVCRRLKARPDTQEIKILGLTGYPGSVPAALKAGADACLVKPVELGQLRQAIEELLTPRHYPTAA